MKEFTEDEKIIARNIDKKCKWMARDKSGILCAFIHKPYKDHVLNRWNSEYPICEMAAFDWMFKSITWCDEDPTLIRNIYDPQILDDEEREYLKTVLEPFRDKIVSVKKRLSCISYDDEFVKKYEEFIDVQIGHNHMWFPNFESGTMYKGMKAGKEYTLEQLGIKY